MYRDFKLNFLVLISGFFFVRYFFPHDGQVTILYFIVPAGSILQQIAMSAAAAQNYQKIKQEARQRATNHKMSLRANPQPKADTYDEVAHPPPSNPPSKRRSRKQKLSQTLPELHTPPVNNLEQIVLVAQPVQQPVESVPREKRKRKSPMRSTMTETFGEPEFTEVYFFEESDNEEEDSYAGNVSSITCMFLCVCVGLWVMYVLVSL